MLYLRLAVPIMLWLLACAAGCPRQAPGTPSTAPTGGAVAGNATRATTPALAGSVAIDGSSTVFPITEAVAEEFQAANPDVNVTVGISGTGGGFKKFCAGEIAISDASRPIKPSEIEAARQGGIEFIELPIAFDGLSVVVNPQNDWVDKLTVDELKKIWEPGSKISNWRDVRAGFPDVPLKLFGPGTDSGTFDYFTEAVCGKEDASRSDYTASEDDNVLVTGVAGEKGALGYFGFAYYEENQDKIKVVPIDNGTGPVIPSAESISNGTYSPLSRPLFIYVSLAAVELPAVDAFARFYLAQAAQLAGEVGYIALPPASYTAVAQLYEQRQTGSKFSGRDTVGLTIEQALAVEQAPPAASSTPQ